MHGLLPKRVIDTVLDAMPDNEKMSLGLLDNETKNRAFALVIYKMLKALAGGDVLRPACESFFNCTVLRRNAQDGNSGFSKCHATGSAGGWRRRAVAA